MVERIQDTKRKEDLSEISASEDLTFNLIRILTSEVSSEITGTDVRDELVEAHKLVESTSEPTSATKTGRHLIQ